jgi:hypothetical protein
MSNLDPGLRAVTTDIVSATTEDQSARLALARSVLKKLMHPAIACAVFFAHVSLLNVEFLEEIGLARAWQQEGIGGFSTRLGLVAARPLLLLPSYAGMALSNGGVRGMYVVMGLIVAGQYLATVWATRPVIRSRSIQAAMGVCVALHPLWPAGWTLRFLAYQVSVLAVVVWAGCLLRFIRDQAGAGVLILGCAALSLGLLHVQSLMLVPIVALAAFGCHEFAAESPDLTVRRWTIAFGATLVTVVANLTYSTVIAPRLSSTSYESEVSNYSIAGISTASRQLFRTTVANAPFLLTYLLVLAASCCLFVMVAGRRRKLFAAAAALVAAAIPLVAIVYSGSAGHTRDPDRVLAPTSVAAVVVGWSVVSRLRLPRVRATVMLVAVAASIGLAATTLTGWLDRGNHDRRLLDEVSSTVSDAPLGTRFVLVDHSGDFGDVYTFLPPHLQLAVDEALNRDIDIQLCTADGVTRHHPDAARYPISTTPACSELLQPGEGFTLKKIDVDGDLLTLVAIPPASG